MISLKATELRPLKQEINNVLTVKEIKRISPKYINILLLIFIFGLIFGRFLNPLQSRNASMEVMFKNIQDGGSVIKKSCVISGQLGLVIRYSATSQRSTRGHSFAEVFFFLFSFF